MAEADARATAARDTTWRAPDACRTVAGRGFRLGGGRVGPSAAGRTAGPALTGIEFACQVRRGVAVVRVSGEIDMATRDGLSATITRYAHDDRVHGVILDLNDVTFLDCTGVSALLAARRAAVASRCRFAVVNLQPSVRRVLQLTSTLEVLGTPGGHQS
ncbi:hypothetical protein Aau02nite_48990 [Amorphoplanes auranticolor]|uniref:Anti-sigma factor antagonist n=2 Tax=Actinoplanes auranticolor TaxID=47988 RepID=A0A919VWQ2_9ACTN|nr:hypothetical protein Aau02nite_48990 [Actinoplanes auranticolor]